MDPLPIPISQLDNEEVCRAADLMEYLGLSRSSFYDRLKALNVKPRKIGKGSYLFPEQVAELLELHQFLSEGGTVATWQALKDAGQPMAGASVALVPVEPDTPDTFDISTFEALQRAAECGWWLTTGQLAELLMVSPGTVSSQGDRFIALGFEFRRQTGRWRGAIQWSVRNVR